MSIYLNIFLVNRSVSTINSYTHTGKQTESATQTGEIIHFTLNNKW